MMNMKKPLLVYLVYGLFFPATLIAGAWVLTSLVSHAARPVQKNARPLMGTIVEIAVAGEDRAHAARAIATAFGEIARVEGKFSAFKDGSVIRRINGLKAGEGLDIDDEALYVIGEAIRYNRITEGAFDITVKPLVDLWGFSTHRHRVPAHDEIAAALSVVGAKYILLDSARKKISLAKVGVRIDLGGIAKGYATDRAIEVLRGLGIKNAIVNSGGDMYCMGERAPGEAWHIGIQHPRLKGKTIRELRVKDAAVVTSGDYEKFFMADGRRLSHIIDPSSGMPVGADPSSVTIIAPHAMEADALATAFMILGYEKGAKVMDKFEGVEWLLTRESKGNVEALESRTIGKYYAKKE